MKNLSIICDRCRTRIDAGRVELAVECGGLRSRRDTLDLCGPCSDALETWIDAPVMDTPPAGPLKRRVAALA